MNHSLFFISIDSNRPVFVSWFISVEFIVTCHSPRVPLFITALSLFDCSFNFSKVEEHQSRHGPEQHGPERGEPSPRGRTEQQCQRRSQLIELELQNCWIKKNPSAERKLMSIDSDLVREQPEENVLMKTETRHWVRSAFNWGLDDLKIISETRSGGKSAT